MASAKRTYLCKTAVDKHGGDVEVYDEQSGLCVAMCVESVVKLIDAARARLKHIDGRSRPSSRACSQRGLWAEWHYHGKHNNTKAQNR